jgi:hypothetical protein
MPDASAQSVEELSGAILEARERIAAMPSAAWPS